MKEPITIYRVWNDFGRVVVSSAKATETEKQYQLLPEYQKMGTFEYRKVILKAEKYAAKDRDEAIKDFISALRNKKARLTLRIADIDKKINQAINLEAE